MSRLATWRLRPDDPPTVARWGTAHLSGWSALLVPLVFVVSPYGWVSLAVGALVLTEIVLLRRFRVCLPPAMRPPVPPVGQVFDVRLTVSDAFGSVTGTDSGWIVFCDGWLLYEGERTEFALTSAEATATLRSRTLVLRLKDGRRLDLTLGLTKPPTPTTPFSAAVEAWRKRLVPAGESIFPPTEVHPSTLASKWAMHGSLAVVYAGFGMATAIAAKQLVFGSSLDLAALPFCAMPVVLFGMVGFSVRNMRELGRSFGVEAERTFGQLRSSLPTLRPLKDEASA